MIGPAARDGNTVSGEAPARSAPAVDRAPADPLSEPVAGAGTASRLAVIDHLRGLVIVLMVLDHVRDFFQPAHHVSPTDVAKTTAMLFATRWVTHLCAPTFVFLAGVAVHLQRERGKRGWRLARFLVARGLWLIALEVTVVTLAFTFSYDGAFLQVIWAIGASMVLLGALAWLPPYALLAIGLAIVGGHDLLDATRADALGAAAPLWTLLWRPGSVALPFAGFDEAYVSYPALPWFGIMAVGYGVGGVFRLPPARRDRLLVAGGLAMLGAFALLRGLNGYGDPKPWTAQADAMRTVLSFLNVGKYPPSLQYTLVTLGIALALAPVIERIGGAAGRALHAFGRTPLFTYLLHLYVARALAVLLALAEGLSPAIFVGGFGSGEQLAASGWGLSLPLIYGVWLLVLLILYPLATRYARYKARHRHWWTSYF